MQIIKQGSLAKDANFLTLYKDRSQQLEYSLEQIFKDNYQITVEEQPEGKLFKLFLSFNQDLPIGMLHVYFALTENNSFLDIDIDNIIFLNNRIIMDRTQITEAAGFTVAYDNIVNINFITGAFSIPGVPAQPQYQKLIVQMLKPQPELLHLFS